MVWVAGPAFGAGVVGSDMSNSKKAAVVIGALLLIGVIAGAALLYVKGQGKSDLSRFAVGELSALAVPDRPELAPDYAFKARDGADASLADFKGQVVVVNVWAMWCAPCRTEMPTLAALATAYEGKGAIVLPINVDATPDQMAAAEVFIDEHAPLPLYTDPKFQLPFELPGKGAMPQTVLLDRQGRIRASFSGEADWNSPEARALIDALLTEKD